MSLTQFIPTGTQLVKELKNALAQFDPNYAEEQLAYEQAKAQLSSSTLAEVLEKQFAAQLLYVAWQGVCWNLDCCRNPVNKLRLKSDYEELHGEYHFPSLPQVHAAEKAIHSAVPHFTQEQQESSQRLADYYAYLETVGFKLAHLWGFLWGNAFFPEVVPGYTPDTALTARYVQMVSMDIGFPIRVLT